MIDSVRDGIDYAVHNQPSMNDGQVDGSTVLTAVVPVSRAFAFPVERKIWNNIRTAYQNNYGLNEIPRDPGRKPGYTPQR